MPTSYHYCKPSVLCSALQGGSPDGLWISICTEVLPTHRSSWPLDPATVQQDTHCMRVCPTSPHRPSPCIPAEVGGGGAQAIAPPPPQPAGPWLWSPILHDIRADMSKLSYLPCWLVSEPPSSQP